MSTENQPLSHENEYEERREPRNQALRRALDVLEQNAHYPDLIGYYGRYIPKLVCILSDGEVIESAARIVHLDTFNESGQGEELACVVLVENDETHPENTEKGHYGVIYPEDGHFEEFTMNQFVLKYRHEHPTLIKASNIITNMVSERQRFKEIIG